MTEPDNTSMQDLAAAYALGALSPEETRAFEAFLASSPEARREVAEFREVGALLATNSVPGVAPSSDLRARVLDRIRNAKPRPIEGSRKPSARIPASVIWIALAASALLAVWLGTALVSTRRELVKRQATADSARSALDSIRTRLAAREQMLDDILDPAMELTLLTSSGKPAPKVQLFWNPKKNTAIVHAFQLSQAPAGRVYQLWFIKDGKPIPSVTFNSEPTGYVLVQNVTVPSGAGITNAAITVEPEGGSLQPTSPVIMIGTMGA
jgi:anti-sigma-K factor RskA